MKGPLTVSHARTKRALFAAVIGFLVLVAFRLNRFESPNRLFTGDAGDAKKVEIRSRLGGVAKTVVIENAEEIVQFNRVLKSAPVSFIGGATCMADLTFLSGREMTVQISISTDCRVLTIIPDDGNPFKDPEFRSFDVRQFPELQKRFAEVFPE